jgi:hypothetical protein
MRKRGLSALALTPLVLAGTAAAAGGPVTASLTPDSAGSPAGFNISVAGPLPPGIPSSLELMVQPGFTSQAAKAVSALCTSAQAASDSCPSGSLIGTGAAGTNALGTLSFTLAVGAPQQTGDIATVFLIGKLGGAVVPLPGRVFVPSGGGLELLVSGFPQLPGVSLTSLTLQANKTAQTVTTSTTKRITTGHGKHKRTHTVRVPHHTTNSLLTNPPTCPSTGMWTGSLTATYSSGPATLPFSAPCAGKTGASGPTQG